MSIFKALQFMCCCQDDLTEAEISVGRQQHMASSITGEALAESLGTGGVARPGPNGFFTPQVKNEERPTSAGASSITTSGSYNPPSRSAQHQSGNRYTPMPMSPTTASSLQTPDVVTQNDPHSQINARDAISNGGATTPGGLTEPSASSPAMTPEERVAERDRLQRLVKDFAKRAIKGVPCDLLDPRTGRSVPHKLHLDRAISTFTFQPLEGGPSFTPSALRLLEITEIYRGADAARKFPESFDSVTSSTAVGIETTSCRVYFGHSSKKECEAHYVIVKILKMFSTLASAKRNSDKSPQA